MNKLSGKLSLLLGAGALLFAAGGILSIPKRAQAADATKNGPKQVECTDAFGDKIELTVEYVDGNYYLADFLRNIYVFDSTGKDPELYDDMQGYLHVKGYAMRDIPVVSSTDGNFEDHIAVSVFRNLVAAYDFYTAENVGFDWKGVNGKNDLKRTNGYRSRTEYPLYAFVHFNIDEGYENNVSFNRWDEDGFLPSIIFVGDGDGKEEHWYMKDQGKSMDTLAHEYQHGVTRFVAKDLENVEDSGAVNEAVSDIFGMLVRSVNMNIPLSSSKAWEYGLEATVNKKPVRSFIDPESVEGYKATYDERMVCDHDGEEHSHECDMGGVHFNSTILTHLQYSIYQKDPEDFTVQTIGKLWMETLKTLPAKPTLIDFAKTFLTAAKTVNLPAKAYDAVKSCVEESGFGTFHTVTFLSDEGEVLARTLVGENEKVTSPTPPEKAEKDGYRYEFKGWDKEFDNITDDMEITAVYDKIRFFKVRFLDAEGNLLKEEKADEGTSVTPPEAPQKASTAQYSYSFKNWSESLANITSDLTVTPVYEETLRKYTVTYYVNGEKKSAELEYGDAVSSLLPDGAEKFYTDKDCTSPFEGTVEGELTLYTSTKAEPADTPSAGDKNPSSGNTTPGGTDDKNPASGDKDPEKNDHLGLIIGLCAAGGAIIVIGAAIAVVIVRKKRKN